jgi:hypothetical protein
MPWKSYGYAIKYWLILTRFFKCKILNELENEKESLEDSIQKFIGVRKLLDGETKPYLGETFGYHVTGFFNLDNEQGIRVEDREGKYFDIIFNTASRSEYLSRYDESKDLYSLEVS